MVPDVKTLSKRWLLRLIFGSLSSFVLLFVLFMVLIAAMFAGLNDKKGGGSDCDITGSISATGNFQQRHLSARVVQIFYEWRAQR